MNLKNPREVAELLRRIEGDLHNSLKHLEHGYLGQVDFSREFVTKFSRAMSALAEHFDPEMPSESLEPYVRGSVVPIDESIAPPGARFELEYLIDVARVSAEALEAGGDIESARYLRNAVIQNLEALVA